MKIKGPIPGEPQYDVQLGKSEIELILDGLTNVRGRYQNTGSDAGEVAFEKIEHMIGNFETIYEAK